jgi:hypothetical protein
MRALTRKGLGGLNEDDLSDPDCDELLNLSLWDLEAKYDFEEKETQWTRILADGVFEYILPNVSEDFLLDAIESVAVIDPEGSRRKLDRMTRSWYDETFDDDDLDLPRFYLRENLILTVYPTPGPNEDGLTLSLTGKEGIATMVEGIKEVTGLPRNWDELVVMGAVTLGHYYAQDYRESRESMTLQTAKIRSTVPTLAKEEQDARYAGLDVQEGPPVGEPQISHRNIRRSLFFG